jgi:hypothetical protein
LNEIIAEKFPNLGKHMDNEVEEAFRTPNRHDQKRTYPHHIVLQISRLENKGRILKDSRENTNLLVKVNTLQLPQTSQE